MVTMETYWCSLSKFNSVVNMPAAPILLLKAKESKTYAEFASYSCLMVTVSGTLKVRKIFVLKNLASTCYKSMTINVTNET